MLDQTTSTGEFEVEATELRSAASQRVMSAAIDLFSKSGFLATTIRDITSACGVTSAAFYNHFESKETLLYEIVASANSTLEESLEELQLGNGPGNDLRVLVNALVMFNLTWPREARIANREYNSLQGSLLEEIIAHRRRVRSLFEKALEDSKKPQALFFTKASGVDRTQQNRLLAISIINLCVASSDWYRQGGALSLADVTEAYCQLALRMAKLD